MRITTNSRQPGRHPRATAPTGDALRTQPQGHARVGARALRAPAVKLGATPPDDPRQIQPLPPPGPRASREPRRRTALHTRYGHLTPRHAEPRAAALAHRRQRPSTPRCSSRPSQERAKKAAAGVKISSSPAPTASEQHGFFAPARPARSEHTVNRCAEPRIASVRRRLDSASASAPITSRGAATQRVSVGRWQRGMLNPSCRSSLMLVLFRIESVVSTDVRDG
jgi:hypothetical protein